MTPFSKRLKQTMTRLGIHTVDRFAVYMSTTRNTMRRWISGDTAPSRFDELFLTGVMEGIEKGQYPERCEKCLGFITTTPDDQAQCVDCGHRPKPRGTDECQPAI